MGWGLGNTHCCYLCEGQVPHSCCAFWHRLTSSPPPVTSHRKNLLWHKNARYAPSRELLVPGAVYLGREGGRGHIAVIFHTGRYRDNTNNRYLSWQAIQPQEVEFFVHELYFVFWHNVAMLYFGNININLQYWMLKYHKKLLPLSFASFRGQHFFSQFDDSLEFSLTEANFLFHL